MKILVAAHSTEKSGAPRVATVLAIGLQDRGHQVAMLFPASGGCEEIARRVGLETIVVDNPPVALQNATMGARIGLGWKRLRALMAMCRLMKSRHDDVVFVSSYVTVLAGLAGRLAGTPVVFQVHEDVVETFANRIRMGLVKWSARAICFVAEKSRQSFGAQPSGQAWSLLPNFIEPSTLEGVSRTGARRTEFGVTAENFVFVCAAYIGHRKGIDVLLRAWRRVAEVAPNARLWIVGGEAGAPAEYVRQIRELAIPTVMFAGHREDVPQILADADAFVLASRNEALPLSILEAMHLGLPVVATDVGDVQRLVDSGRTGLVVPLENETALATAMLDVLSDPIRAKAWGEAGRDKAQMEFDRTRILDDLEAVLRKAMTG